MRETRNRCFGGVAMALLLVMAGVAVSPGFAVAPRDEDPLRAKEFRHPDLGYRIVFRPVAELPVNVARRLGSELRSLGVDPGNAYFDLRTGRWGTVILTQPLIPGPGAGNSLQWSDLGLRAAPGGGEALEQAVWEAFRSYLESHAAVLRIDPAELAEPTVTATGDRLTQIHVGREIGGIRVRDTFVKAALNSGNLILLGVRNWGDVLVDTTPRVSSDEAEGILNQHVSGSPRVRLRERPYLEIIPVSSQPEESERMLGGGLEYRLVWVVRPVFEEDLESWEGLVDAHSGELLSFVDTNHYASRRVEGWIYPVSNDGQGDDGILQPGFPMPFANVALDGSDVGFTTTGGNAPSGSDPGTISTTLSGEFIRMSDSCGATNESAEAGDLDLEGVEGTDCDVPPGHSPGDTNASRTGFYELNRLTEQARGYLPDNAWLGSQLTSNMNLPSVCNAFWDGVTVNFFRSAPAEGCANTGELAGVFDHEWGHGMDNNDANPTISRPGEGIADIYAQNRLNTSCMGRGFFTDGAVCGGYGDACLDCTGVREVDWEQHASGEPHDIDWILSLTGGTDGGGCLGTSTSSGIGPCGWGTHCEGHVVSETVWDLVHRDFMGFEGSDFDLDLNTALELGTRLTYYGSSNVGDWYQCTTDGTGGCNADSGYLGYLAADDDNGDLTDGTPHMSAIFAAFDRHQVACPTPTVQNSGCSGGPTTAPANVSAARFDEGVGLTWDPVAGASEYWIFRTEGVHGCDFGKAMVGKTSEPSFTENGLRNGFEVLYGVVAVGDSDACTSPMSACLSVIPTAGPSGFIAGTVTDADSGTPIEAASVEAVGPVVVGDVTDGTGSYQILVPVGTYDVTASVENHAPETVTGVEVELDHTTIVDLELQGSSLFYSPDSIEETVEVGDMVSNTVTVTGTGPLPIDFSVSIRDFEGPTASDPVQIVVSAGAQGAPEGTAVATSASSAGARPSPAPTLTYTDSNGSMLGSTTILIVHADDGDGEPLRSMLLEYPDIEAVDVWDARGEFENGDGIPPFEVLEAYELVITWSNFEYADPNAMGDVLADYVDGGGLVIQAVFNWIDDNLSGLSGRFVTEGYSPFVNINGGNHANLSILGDYDPSHPLMGGVTEASDLFRDIVDLDPDAELVASWADEEEFVATKDGVVAINSYPGFYRQWTGDVGIIFHNAVNFLLEGTGVQWASAEPDSGTVEPGEELTFHVIFDATSLTQEGTYTANLEFSGTFVNDPPVMPLTMHLECPTCGFLDGEIFDAFTDDPLSATITIEGLDGFNITVSGDSYSVSVPADTYTISVTANGYFPDSATVAVEIGETVTTDFHLIPMVALLEYGPDFIEEEMEAGDMVSNTVTVTNPGTIPLEFSVRVWDFAGPPASDSNGSMLGSTTILIVHADEGDGEPLRSILLEYPDIEAVDVWDARGGFEGIPPLQALEAYELVITWSNFAYANRIAMGDVLADYVDGGGLVIQAAFNWFDNNDLGLSGRFVDEGYSPLVTINGGNHFNVSTLGDHDPSHPLMEGVTEASDFFRDIVDLDPDATLVASWADGEEFVATKDSVVAINSYPGIDGQWTGDVGMIFHNAVNFLLAGTGVQWAYAEPDSGTVEPGEELTFQVVFDATSLSQEGTHTANLNFTGNLSNDPPVMPLTMHLECPTCGFLDGEIFDAFTDDPLSATITIEGLDGFNITVSGDSYSVSVPADTYTISVTANGYFPDSATVAVEIGETVTTDFHLIPMVALLEYGPDFIEEEMEAGDMVSNTVTVTNPGTIPLEFSVRIRDFTDPPAAFQSLEVSELSLLLGSTAYSQNNAAPGYYTVFDLDVPGVLPNVAPFDTGAFIGAGELVDGSVYMIDGSHTMYEVDPPSGDLLSTTPVTPPGIFRTYTGMALDPTTGEVYLTSCDFFTTLLYLLDVSSGETTTIGTVTNSPCTMAIAIDGAGELWGLDVVSDSLLCIDKSTAAGEIIGSLGFDPNFGQGMAWDPATDTLFLAAFDNGSFQAELRVADRDSGNTALVGVLGATEPGGTNQLGYLALELSTTPPWAFAEPDSGIVEPGEELSFQVFFDASLVEGLGTYTANLSFTGNLSNAPPVMPLTMHVTGGGVPELAFNPPSLDFGEIEVGSTSLPQTATLQNFGGGDATGLTFGPTGGGFEADTSACGDTLSAGASCPVSVTLTPIEPGPASATLEVTSDQDASAGLGLAGTGVSDGVITPTALEVDPEALLSDGNRVFEPGELIEVAPAWRNNGLLEEAVTGTASSFNGSDGATYLLPLDDADYGNVEPGATASCLDTGVCYWMGVNAPPVRPATHWQATFNETLSGGTTHTWSLHIGDSFLDVPRSNPFYPAVETLLHHGVTGGCTATEYCPTGTNTRGQMAVFLLKAAEGGEYAPPACEVGQELFADVPFDSPLCPWIEELAARQVASGCGGGNYCPGGPVTRAQMAVFLLKAFEGGSYTPPECTGEFTDVDCPSTFADWVEELSSREITGGCSTDPPAYCPSAPVTRQQMAVFVTKTFGLTLYGP